ncbi:hypothetical protein JET18_07155 [Chryseobacterium sp. L7]|uniref:DUF4397 domain-containing protein n=1 Tax=Chryseobacterium endalhagicum TaxID=2797638 RepID=A0ABS1QDC5_9FLAO|nr:hypothetical protein [Chryseobacterium endalhagicum]MBL1220610.1 hypothetical protein [Chryseobacterium endalhagicum]
MNKKIIILAGALFLSVQAYSQIGINTPTPSSTMDVRGSVEGNYLEITGDYPLLSTDYHVSFSGTGNSKLTLPSKSATDNSVADFRGRKYYIKNNSTSSTLTLTAASGQILRLGGSITNSNTFGLRPGRSAILTAGGANGWDLETDTGSWELYDLDFKGPKLVSVSAPGRLTDSQVTVTVPSSDAIVLLEFTAYGQGTQSGAEGAGNMDFLIAQQGPSGSGYAGTAGMISWYDYPGNTAPKFNFAGTYSISGLTPGVYTFNLTPSNTSVTNYTANTRLNILGSTGRAEVYIP